MRVLSRNHPEIDEGWLCDKGRFAYDHLRAGDRIRTPLLRVRRRGFEEVSYDDALDAAEAGLREAGSSVVVAFSGGETVEQATAIARIVREALGAHSALLPDDWDAGLAAFRAPLSAIRDADVCLVLGDDPVVERAPIVDLWLRAARRAGGEVIAVNPAGDVQVAAGSAPQVCAALREGGKAPKELRETVKRIQGAKRVAIVWSRRRSVRRQARRCARQRPARGQGRGGRRVRLAEDAERARSRRRLVRRSARSAWSRRRASSAP